MKETDKNGYTVYESSYINARQHSLISSDRANQWLPGMEEEALEGGTQRVHHLGLVDGGFMDSDICQRWSSCTL